MLAVDFIGKFRSPEDSSYRVQSPRIAASRTFFARAANGPALARANGDTVKSPETSLSSETSRNRCDVAKPPPNFPYRQWHLARKIAAPTKLDNGGRG
jgi:hypothetical protein